MKMNYVYTYIFIHGREENEGENNVSRDNNVDYEKLNRKLLTVVHITYLHFYWIMTPMSTISFSLLFCFFKIAENKFCHF